jgi:nitroreductase
MDFFDVVEKRCSIRVFEKRPVERELTNRLLEAVRSAPTAGNLQAYRIYLVESPETIRALATAAEGQECVSGASLVLVFCADAPRSVSKYGERGESLYCIQDTTIVATFAHLAATALGLGSVLVGAFGERDVARVVGAPHEERPLLMLALGHPAEPPVQSGRRALDDLVVRL